MIKTELHYNPYCRQTLVKFNGQLPHINSLIEKYQNRPLQDWVDKIPQIFHDEMNGYGFELDFYGTEIDFEEVCRAFQKANVSERDVLLDLKKGLECRERKIERIHHFMQWIQKNPYRKFDAEQFCLKHHRLFKADFVCVVLHGETNKPELNDISIEKVDDTNELIGIDLTHTPILYCVSKESIPLLQKEIVFFRQRKDISKEQLFFCIDSDLKIQNINRLLNDLEITEPIIVTGINDELVKKYFLMYPFSDYIAFAVNEFQKSAEELTAIVNEDNEKSKRNGDKTQEQLARLSESMHLIQNTDETILAQADFEFPREFETISKEFITRISNWEIRKIKITDLSVAQNAAIDFNAALQMYFAEFCMKLQKQTMDCMESLKQKYRSLYDTAVTGETFTENIVFPDMLINVTIENQTEHLLTLKEQKCVEQKSNPVIRFFRPSEQSAPTKQVFEVAYYYQTWRTHMMNLVMPVIENLIQERFDQLDEYSKKLSAAYHQQLQTLLIQKQKAWNQITANLSEDEKLLQKDNEWLKQFLKHLETIEWS